MEQKCKHVQNGQFAFATCIWERNKFKTNREEFIIVIVIIIFFCVCVLEVLAMEARMLAGVSSFSIVSSAERASFLARAPARISCLSAPSPSRSYRLTILPGDGIGPEIADVALHVLRLIGSQEGIDFQVQEKLVGGAAIDAFGTPLPDDTLAACRASDAVLLAAIGGYKWDNNESHLRPERGLLGLRAGLGVFANLRPAVVLPQLVGASTLKPEVAEGVDIMVVRELTGGIYFGEPKGFGRNANGDRIGFNTEVYSTTEEDLRIAGWMHQAWPQEEDGYICILCAPWIISKQEEMQIDRIARVAFGIARKRHGKLCSVDKANVLEASQLWRERVVALAKEYPDVEVSHMYVDNASMQLIRNPKQFDTIVTNNIFGDILSDEASMLTGSIGMLPSASISESGPGLFEPVHGSAPDIAGQDKANPLAMVLSAAMLLKYGLGEVKAAERIEKAVLETLEKGFRTGDIMSAGKMLLGCTQMGQEVLKALEGQPAVACS